MFLCPQVSLVNTSGKSGIFGIKVMKNTNTRFISSVFVNSHIGQCFTASAFVNLFVCFWIYGSNTVD